MRTMSLIMLLLAAVWLLVRGALWAQSRVPASAVVRAQRMELVDKGGKIRAELKTSEEDTLLVLYDGHGRLRMVIGTESVVFYGVDGKLRGKIDVRNLAEGAGQAR